MPVGSITLFAVITVILGCLKIGYFVGFSECLSATEGVFPVAHTVHTLLQVYFLWGHAKDIIQSFKTLERFGVIHSVFTNLLLWANGVLNESKHQLNEHKERLLTLGFGNITAGGNEIATPNQQPTLGKSLSLFGPHFLLGINIRNSNNNNTQNKFYYLYPFNIEYQILASTMLYVLWKNIGRRVDGRPPRAGRFRAEGATLGAGLGLTALAATIAVVAGYLARIGRSKAKSQAALTMFYLHAIALRALMGAAGLAGVRLHRTAGQPPGEASHPARKLDADLLLGAATGSWLLSWGSLLAVLCCGREEESRRVEAPSPAGPARRLRGGAKRSVLRNIAAFLFLCNISLWIPPAFGCRPEYDNGLEEIVFGFEPWIIVVNLAMPFSIFYRMHAAASLFEVYCKI
ncbi:otopetrin-1 [Carlito syrichta]|uniref:Otopetrin-1 n=1 Tax=Carlito syrichta TaxID=1868482 RepID=A0A3Q0EEH7_CARSF|nr:otopetrin-1 [Carlito syrichta]